MIDSKKCPFCGEELRSESNKLLCDNDDCMLLELEGEYMLVRLDRPVTRLNLDILEETKFDAFPKDVRFEDKKE